MYCLVYCDQRFLGNYKILIDYSPTLSFINQSQIIKLK